jgi:hypothetical protein
VDRSSHTGAAVRVEIPAVDAASGRFSLGPASFVARGGTGLRPLARHDHAARLGDREVPVPVDLPFDAAPDPPRRRVRQRQAASPSGLARTTL